jgi:hypothetical protein
LQLFNKELPPVATELEQEERNDHNSTGQKAVSIRKPIIFILGTKRGHSGYSCNRSSNKPKKILLYDDSQSWKE